jgi:hypothetical protein
MMEYPVHANTIKISRTCWIVWTFQRFCNLSKNDTKLIEIMDGKNRFFDRKIKLSDDLD